MAGSMRNILQTIFVIKKERTQETQASMYSLKLIIFTGREPFKTYKPMVYSHIINQ